ncbi:MAG: type I DNA topoisomerase [Prevotellaceae bacterium]|jgi:DNA topoisomerase-1|nr:type I DNA topoisomerase [Prevotellaceae bacterium]
MQENLVIVESPAKAKTIEKFLGKDFLVKSSFGHIRDLSKSKQFGIDIKNNFEPDYVVSEDKLKVVAELKKLAKQAKTVWLASDEDREGEAIAWHLMETLKLEPDKTKRIVFHEITQSAILHAIQNPRTVDMNLVNAQQARRVLDRLVGFEVSPVLWRKVKEGLSAGRVQSVAVRLIVEREREALNFQATSSFKVSGLFEPADGKKFKLKAELSEKFKDEKTAQQFLENCKTAGYTVNAIEKKPSKKMPAPPFTTSTLQQEASRKYGFSVSQTMSIAQRLYEAGRITYMRTDSTNLSETALKGAKSTIEQLFGSNYSKTRQYATKTKGAQEAHEAIRPTYMNQADIEGSAQECKLYDLIWKRAIASQMAEAQLEKTEVTIGISTAPQTFQARGEVILFDGFLKVYMETNDDEPEDQADSGLLPPLKNNQSLDALEITATERFSQRPPRYTEASLVKRLEELGIGRPSTYAPTISTIITRGYVMKEDRPGVERKYTQWLLQQNNLTKKILVENTGAEKSKLFPSDIGMLVNDFLNEYFQNIVDYGFTANVEEEFDEIAEGKLQWNKMIGKFYKPFHSNVTETLETSRMMNAERILGTDPKTGKTVSVRIGRYGPLAQLGEAEDEKKQFASLQKGQLIETITLEDALKLFELPRAIGSYEDKDVTAAIGRFGPYVRFGSEFVSLKKEDSPYTVTIERAIELIEEKRKKDSEKHIKTFEKDDIQILNGRFGPYIAHGGNNYKIPKGAEPAKLTLEESLEIIASQKDKKGTKGKGAKVKGGKVKNEKVKGGKVKGKG